MKNHKLLVKFIPIACLALLLLSTIVHTDKHSGMQTKTTVEIQQNAGELSKDTLSQPTYNKDNHLDKLTSEKEQYLPTKKTEVNQQAESKQDQVKKMTEGNPSNDITNGIRSISQTSVSSGSSLDGYDPAKITEVPNVDELESSHNYSNNQDHMWVYRNEGAPALRITFNSQTFVENGCDYIYLYDKDNICIGTYTGTQLSEKIITVWGDTIKIRLCSDDAVVKYGFKVTSITTLQDYEEYSLVYEELPSEWIIGDTKHQTLKLEKKYIEDGVGQTKEVTENVRFVWKVSSGSDIEAMDVKIEGNNLTVTAIKEGIVSGCIEAYESSSTTPIAVTKTYKFEVSSLVVNDDSLSGNSICVNEIQKKILSYLSVRGVGTVGIVNNVVSSDTSIVSIVKNGALGGRSFTVKGIKPGKADITVYYTVKDGDKVISASSTYNFTCNEAKYYWRVNQSGTNLSELCPTQTSEITFDLTKNYYDKNNIYHSDELVDPSKYTIEVIPKDSNNALIETSVKEGKLIVKALSKGAGNLDYVMKIDGQAVAQGNLSFSIEPERYLLSYNGPTEFYPTQIVKGPTLIHYVYEEGLVRQQVMEDAVITCNNVGAFTYRDGNVVVNNVSSNSSYITFTCKYNNVTYSKSKNFSVSTPQMTSSGIMYKDEKVKMSLDLLPEIDNDCSIIWSVENYASSEADMCASIETSAEGTAILTCLKVGRIKVTATFKKGEEVLWTSQKVYTIEDGFNSILDDNYKSIYLNQSQYITAHDFRKNNTYYNTVITSIQSSDQSIVEVVNYTKTKYTDYNDFRINIIGKTVGRANVIINYTYFDEEGTPIQGTDTVIVTIKGSSYYCLWEQDKFTAIPGESIPLNTKVMESGCNTNGKWYNKPVDLPEVKVEYSISNKSVATENNGLLTFNDNASNGASVYVTPYIMVDGKKYNGEEQTFTVTSSFNKIQGIVDDIVYIKEDETKVLNLELYQYDINNTKGKQIENVAFLWNNSDQSGSNSETLTNSCFSINGRTITGTKMGSEKVTLVASYKDENNITQNVIKSITVRVAPKAIPVLELGQKGIITNPDRYFVVTPEKTGTYKIACSDEIQYPLIEVFDQEWKKMASYEDTDSENTEFFYVHVNLEAGKTYYVRASSIITGVWPSYIMSIESAIDTKEINNCDIQLSAQQFIFNGQEQRPIITIKDGNYTLKEDSDYVIVENGDMAAAGGYTLVIQGIGNYEGCVEKTCVIQPITLIDTMVQPYETQVVFNGQEQKPELILMNGKVALIQGTDYDVNYKGDFTTNGIHTMTICGYGNYTGTLTTTLAINDTLDITKCFVELSSDKIYYSGKEEKPTITVKSATTVLTEGTDYEVVYPDAMTNIGTYEITIHGKGIYEGTVTKEFTINPLDFTQCLVELSKESIIYSGTEEKPNITVKNGTTVLTEDTDYEVVYPDAMINAGTYVISIHGIGIYGGTVTKEFIVQPLNFTEFLVELSKESIIYSGTEEKPTITVRNGDTALTEGTDYEVVYPDTMTNAGTYEITIHGKGNYEGIITKGYIIKPLDFTGSVVELSSDSIIYSGTDKKPTITVKNGVTVLLEGTDYEVVYPNAKTDVGTYDIEIHGKGNYEGIITKEYTIKPCNLEECLVELSEKSMIYSGSEEKPIISVKNGTTSLTEGTDYEVVYPNAMINAGTYVITIHGIGNYSGTLTTNYTITKGFKTLAFVKSAISKKYGEKPFINALTSSSVKTVTYTSSNTKVAKVDTKGMVTIVGGGKATITAVFAGNQNYNGTKASYTLTVAKINNSITAGNVVKTASSKAQVFTLTVSRKGNATLSYTSNNKGVVVKAGKVTIAKNFVGTAVITITAASNSNYNAISKKITITVNPTGTKVTSLKNQSKNKFLLKWSRNKLVSGYEIQYASNKSFSKATKKTITKSSTTSYQASKLKKKTTYYVRIRTYKIVNKVKYYSGWSKVTYVKIKK